MRLFLRVERFKTPRRLAYASGFFVPFRYCVTAAVLFLFAALPVFRPARTGEGEPILFVRMRLIDIARVTR